MRLLSIRDLVKVYQNDEGMSGKTKREIKRSERIEEETKRRRLR